MQLAVRTSTSYREMVAAIVSLPIPLILLVHLHILDYPHANKPEYDHNIFNPRVRGLRERIRLMEDVSYFLVGRVEGGRDKAKSILPSYPSIQPSETVAFRTSLSKYLENLRHQAIYPASALKSSMGTSSKGKGKDTTSNSDMAWWWKDVMVRKSLLEECLGDKFERLLLSLSTHALMRCSAPIPFDATSSLSRNQPIAYTNNLVKYQSVRQSWSRSAAVLTRRQQDLRALHDLILFRGGGGSSKYDSCSARQLQTLAESKMQELLQRHWASEEERKCFRSFAMLIGLTNPNQTHLPAEQVLDGILATKNPACPATLPIAAAHHPSHLKRLRRTIFQTKQTLNQSSIGDMARPTETIMKSHAEIALSEGFQSEKLMCQALADALSRTRKQHSDLTEKLKHMKATQRQPVPFSSLNLRALPEAFRTFNWEPRPTPDMFKSLLLPVPAQNAEEETSVLESRIEQIRDDLLAPYPPRPDPSAPRLVPSEPSDMVAGSSLSRIPRQGIKAHTHSATLAAEVSSMKLESRVPISSSASTMTGVSTPDLRTTKSFQQGKSTRFSIARRGRPSMFRVSDTGGMDDEVHRLIDATGDHSDTGEDEDVFFKTPKAKKINRIWTVGSAKATPRSALKPIVMCTPRQSFPAALMVEAAVSLPSLLSSTSSDFFGDLDSRASGDNSDDSWDLSAGLEANATPLASRRLVCLPDLSLASVVHDSDEFEDNRYENTVEAGSGLEESEDVFGNDPPKVDEDDINLADDKSFVWE
ncbi:hypothetical protein B0H34DRAFT_478423 [Crassisporium funariophilum]|nr:hypothetical protein B0H34DRAFT_478423 [Crassisporium funariophilum]